MRISTIPSNLSFLAKILGLLLLISTTQLYAYTIRGQVKIKNAQLLRVQNTRQQVRLDPEGNFTIEIPAFGYYTIRVIGSEGFQDNHIFIGSEGQVLQISSRKPKKGPLYVRGKKQKQILSPHSLQKEVMRKMPGTLGDSLKSIETLPGVNTPAFGSGAIIIRGSNPEHNQYFFDTLPIYYPFHLLGLNSVINNELIDSVNLYTGVYPAVYANASAGVIEITSPKEPALEKQKNVLQTSLFTSSFFYIQQLKESDRLIASARINYIEETYGNTGLFTEGVRLPQYTDSQIVYTKNFSEKHQLRLYSLTANDFFSADIPTNINSQNPLLAGARLATSTGFHTSALRYTYTPNDSSNYQIHAIYYRPFDRVNGRIGSLEANYLSSPGYYALRQDSHWKLSSKLHVSAGIELRRLNYQFTGNTSIQSNPSNLSPNPYAADPDYEQRNLQEKQQSFYYAGYLAGKWQYKNYTVQPQIRYEEYEFSRANALSPRLYQELRWKEGKSKIFSKVSLLGRFPTDFSFSERFGNPDLKFEKSQKVSLGFSTTYLKYIDIDLEGFQEKYYDLVVEDIYETRLLSRNTNQLEFLSQPFLWNQRLYYSNNGKAYTRGYEVKIKKKKFPLRKLYSWVSYTWSQSFYNSNTNTNPRSNYTSEAEALLFGQVPNSRTTFYDFDSTHLINFVLGWKFTPEWQLGLRWQYKTSFPFTRIIADDGGNTRNPFNLRRIYFPVYSQQRNSERLPAYHRLDIRLDRSFHYKWGSVNYFIEAINAYGRRNFVGRNFKSSSFYSENNPTNQLDLAALPLQDEGVLPLINVGLEVRF
ncbi:MAG: TonB-dependent receptor plug domain-containing protein [Spirochaetota bacterium]